MTYNHMVQKEIKVYEERQCTLTSLARVCLPLFSLAIELDVKNIVNVVHGANLSDGHWEQLGS